MAFYLAKGEPGACGPGCNQWIAADGFIDVHAAERLSGLLGRLHGLKPPVFFNSIGGSQTQAIAIGQLIRDHGLTAGVWKTIPTGCAGLAENQCWRLKQTSQELSADLRSIALCASSCVYALLGGTSREVPPNAVLIVHLPRPVRIRPDGSVVTVPLKVAVRTKNWAAMTEEVRTYIRKMGVDRRLFQLIEATPNEQLHTLTRTEIVAFGIDTRQWSCSTIGPSEPCPPPVAAQPATAAAPAPAAPGSAKP